MTCETAAKLEKLTRFFATIYRPGDYFEIRALLIPEARSARSGANVISGVFRDPAKAAGGVLWLQKNHPAYNVYYTLGSLRSNPDVRVKNKPVLLLDAVREMGGINHLRRSDPPRYDGGNPVAVKTATDLDVGRRRAILIDCDAGQDSKVCSTDEEKADARRLADQVVEDLKDAGVAEPIVVDSGSGYHLLLAWDDKLPTPIADVFRHFLSAVAHRVNGCFGNARVDTSVFNAGRIARVPFTVNQKGANTPERPHRISSVVFCPAEFSARGVEPFVMKLAKAEGGRDLAKRLKAANLPPSPSGPSHGGLDLRQAVVDLLDLYADYLFLDDDRTSDGKTYYYLAECPFRGGAHEGGGGQYRKTSIIVSDSAVGFHCFSDDCCDYKFADLLKLLYEQTGISSSHIRFWPDPDLDYLLAKFGCEEVPDTGQQAEAPPVPSKASAPVSTRRPVTPAEVARLIMARESLTRDELRALDALPDAEHVAALGALIARVPAPNEAEIAACFGWPPGHSGWGTAAAGHGAAS